MKIIVTSIFVEDQDKALKYYTETLGFLLKENIPMGEYSWLTVISPDQENGIELVLEPNVHPAAKVYQKSLFEDGIPATMFAVDNIQEEYNRLKEKGVQFTMEPVEEDGFKMTVFDDSCGNLIQIVQA